MRFFFDEAWRILVHNIGNLIPSGYSVRQAGRTIDFLNFKLFKGRMHIRIEESHSTLFVVIGRNMECKVIGSGGSISTLDPDIKSFLHDRRRIIKDLLPQGRNRIREGANAVSAMGRR